MQTDKTAEALKEFFNELNGILQAGAGRRAGAREELRRAAPPAHFETTRSLARIAGADVRLQPAAGLLRDVTSKVHAVTAADVQRAAERYIQPDKFAVVVVGDLKTIEPGVRALNLGPISTVTVDEIMK